MENFLDISAHEEKRLKDLINQMEEVFEQDKKIRAKISDDISKLRQDKLDAHEFDEKNAIEKKIEELHQKSSLYIFQEPKILRSPYFGVLELKDNSIGDLSYKIGKKTIFGKDGNVSVVDWREAPISRLFYEYETGDDYDEDIRDQERTGLVDVRRSVVIKDRDLKSISEKETTLLKETNGTWIKKEKEISVSQRKEEKQDHSLPEITSLISREQFQAITLNPQKIFILQGGAGSGKTTVGLHRVAYLVYNDPQIFKPSDIVLLVYNKALQKYIKGVLPQLGIAGGVKTLTYHNFATLVFNRADLKIKYGNNNPRAAAIKKSSFAVKLIQRYCDFLFERSFKWISKRFEDAKFEEGVDVLSDASDLSEFIAILNSNSKFSIDVLPPQLANVRKKLLIRLKNHKIDLLKLLTDKDFILDTAKKAEFYIDENALNSMINSQKSLHERGEIDFSDTGILIYLMQLKGMRSARPGYSHIMVDEAQDLSPVELSTILTSADEKTSITICGDMAQKIKSDVFFDSKKGFSGFIRSLSGLNSSKIAAETLEIGYRATKEIMDIAWHVMGKDKKPESKAKRSGEKVDIFKTSSMDETIFKASAILADFHEKRPQALTCIICRIKRDANRVYEVLKNDSSIKNIRRHQRDDFVFYPGIVVTNIHQVKGLEFTSVMVINPSKNQFKESDEDRMLLHVAFTRASEKLWVIGHEEMGCGIEDYR